MNVEAQQGSMQTTAAKNRQSLKQLLISLKKPEKRFIIGEEPKVTAFEFDPTFQHLFMGFRNGEVNTLF